MLLRLMWSSASRVPLSGVCIVQSVVGADVAEWTANRTAVEAWSDHMIPTVAPTEITAEMSSAETATSGAGTGTGPDHAVSEVVLYAIITREPCVRVVQSRPLVSRATVMLSDPPPATVTGNPASLR